MKGAHRLPFQIRASGDYIRRVLKNKLAWD